VIGFELFGALTLMYSGWLGGTLVTRNLISVDPRYAQAGKWQEAELTGRAGEPLVVGHVDDLKADQMKLLRVNGQRIVLARTATGYCAFEDRCSHRGGSLAGGVLVKGTVQCLWHGSQFDTATGALSCGPAKAPIRAFEVKETRNGQIVLVSPP
jgi:nitrite reductase/ring-hydroxylating ferredoxin subunit